MKKKLISVVIGVCLLFNSAPAFADGGEPQLTSTSNITSGAVLKNYTWDTVDGPVKASVIECDLTDPYLNIGVITGEGKLGQRSNVSAMASRTGAAAMINGDLYNTKGEGSPISTTMIDGKLVTSPSVIPGIYALGITQDNRAIIQQFDFQGSVTTANGVSFPLSGVNKSWYWEFPAGVHSHLDKLHLYTDMWGAKTRANDDYANDLAEVMIKDGIVTAISPDGYFDSDVPTGCMILRAQGAAKIFVMDNIHVGDHLNIQYAISPNYGYKTIIGGDGILVSNGQMVDYGKSTEGLTGVRARTAIGISQDGRKVYLVAVEGRTSASKGITLGNLSLFLTKIGVWQAINLDGGGSTTMVARPLGDFSTEQTIAVEGHAAERRVVEGVGVYSTAPKGSLKGLTLNGAVQLLIGESTAYTVKGYDEYYNPVVTSNLPLQYADSNALGTWQGSTYTPERSGSTLLSVTSGGVKATLPLQVVGKESISTMTVTAAESSLVEGSTTQLKVEATLKDGTKKSVSPNVLTWTVSGFEGSVSDSGVLTVSALNGSTAGTVTADYEGFTTTMNVSFQPTNQLHLLNTLDGLEFTRTPSSTTGGLSVTADPAGSGAMVTKLDYNFGQAADSVAAYMNFTGGLALSSGVQNLYIDVYGSGHGEWLRAEITDGNGDLQRVNLSTNVDWQGWKQLAVNINSLGLQGPLTLERIYVVETAREGRNQTEPYSLYFKNLQTLGGTNGTVAVQLQIGSTQMTQNGVVSQMDVAPVIANDRTMVPIRFVSEALGAQAEWVADRQAAVIAYNGIVLELPVNQKTIYIQGQATEMDVATQLINDRTMVPLRAVTEGLGLTVEYQPETQTITIQ